MDMIQLDLPLELPAPKKKKLKSRRIDNVRLVLNRLEKNYETNLEEFREYLEDRRINDVATYAQLIRLFKDFHSIQETLWHKHNRRPKKEQMHYLLVEDWGNRNSKILLIIEYLKYLATI